MNLKRISMYVGCLISIQTFAQTTAQTAPWTLKQCIDYALDKNIQIQQAALNNKINEINVDQAQASRLPNVNASVSQNFNWSKPLNENTMSYGSYDASNGTNYGINAGVTLFNGFRISNTIKQRELESKAGQFDLETTKESISLNILDLFLQVLYSKEQVKNAQIRVNVTAEQLRLADERMRIGAISKLDFMQVKSQLATDKNSLATAESVLANNKLSLMQIMLLSDYKNFDVDTTMHVSSFIQTEIPSTDSIYQISVNNKPQIKSAQLNEQSAQMAVSIAKAGYIPKLSLNGGLNTQYSNQLSMFSYSSQLENRLVPSIGLSLSIPIYQNKAVKSDVSIAQIQTSVAQLQTSNIQNQLRKAIEQACIDYSSAQKQYDAALEAFNTANESYSLATEKFNLGMLASVEYFVQKTNLSVVENNLLQAKYNLVFCAKTLDYYAGKQLGL